MQNEERSSQETQLNAASSFDLLTNWLIQFIIRMQLINISNSSLLAKELVNIRAETAPHTIRFK